jgi:hypothetical protein
VIYRDTKFDESSVREVTMITGRLIARRDKLRASELALIEPAGAHRSDDATVDQKVTAGDERTVRTHQVRGCRVFFDGIRADRGPSRSFPVQALSVSVAPASVDSCGWPPGT